jgi:5'-nucleotidase
MKKIVYIDMDGVVADFDAHRHLITERCPLKQESKVPENYFFNLPLIEGSVEALNELSKYYELYFLSVPQWTNPSCWMEKRLWVEKHFGELMFKRLILTHHKRLLKGDYLIDDNVHEGFEGRHIHFGTTLFPTWKEVVKLLVGLAEIQEVIDKGVSIVYNSKVYR